MKKLKRRWFKIDTIPIYYKDDGSIDYNVTFLDILSLYQSAVITEPSRLSDKHDCFVDLLVEPGHIELEVKDEDSKDV